MSRIINSGAGWLNKIFRRRIAYVYHPQDIGGDKWLICNALVGALPYAEHDSPLTLSKEMLPEWYAVIKDENALEYVWAKQEEYQQQVVSWFVSKQIVEIHFDGAFDSDERWLHLKYPTLSTDSAKWQDEMANDLLKVNLRNIYLRAQDGSLLIAYESWDNLFIKDLNSDFPDRLRRPMVVAGDLPLL